MIRPTILLNNCGSQSVKNDWWLAHRTEMQRLYYIKSGSGTYLSSDGLECPFLNGKLYIFPYNLHATHKSDPTDPIDHIYFDFITTPPIISNVPIICDISAHPALLSTIRTADALLSERFACSHIINHNILEILLTLVSEIHAIPYSTDAEICNAIQYIHENYHRPISVRDLAARANLEENYFIRRFKKVMEQTPYSYLRSYRLIRASEYIQHGKTMSQIAELVGYENASSLSRALNSKSDKV